MDVLTAAQNVAEDFRGDTGRGASALARAIDKPASTFSNELTETYGAKLGLLTAVKMTRRAKDPRILNAFAAECGYMVLPLPDTMLAAPDEAVKLVGVAMSEFNDVAQAFIAGAADQQWTGNEVHELERQGGELIAAVQRLMAHAKCAHEAAKPAALRRAA
jgi:hypothetical protein